MPYNQADFSSLGQALFGGTQGSSVLLGWSTFLDMRFILDSFVILLVATLLGAAIGYHPATKRKIDKLREADMPHAYVLYAVIGAVIGVAVREFGTVIGLVVFGIGGLMRFRSSADSTHDTARLIIVTLIGLIAGLGLLHFAVTITLFAFVLIYIFAFNPAFRIKVEQLPKDRETEAAAAYRGILKTLGCRIISEHYSAEKGRIDFVFRLPRRSTRDRLEADLRTIAADLRGAVDWEVG
jgi:Domain of unknown function (DUF4956)